MQSIRRTLLLWLSAGLLAGIGAAAVLIYFQARQQADELFDYQMQQIVASLPGRPFASMDSLQSNDAEASEQQTDVVIQIWDSNGMRIYRSHEHTALPERAELGFLNVDANGDNWRVYSAQIGKTVVQVAQSASARRAVAAKMALKTLTPLVLSMPFLIALIWVTVGRGLSSVRRVALDVAARDATSLTPISEADLPQEIRPLTNALNALLIRLNLSISAQRAFVADAAHELKTPLTALSLQLQLAERANTDAERKGAFHDLKQGLARASHLVHQLLTLARQEPDNAEAGTAVVDLSALAREVVGEFAAGADARKIDLGLYADGPAMVDGNFDSLRTMLNNIVDNAIRYCQDGATVEVSVSVDAHGASIIVEDNGPGIPEADLQRVLDRFYRVPGTGAKGSGLGLAIVKQIASAHRASLTLTNREHGLRVCVAFPMCQ